MTYGRLSEFSEVKESPDAGEVKESVSECTMFLRAMFCTTGVRRRLELEGRLSVDLHLLQ